MLVARITFTRTSGSGSGSQSNAGPEPLDRIYVVTRGNITVPGNLSGCLLRFTSWSHKSSFCWCESCRQSRLRGKTRLLYTEHCHLPWLVRWTPVCKTDGAYSSSYINTDASCATHLKWVEGADGDLEMGLKFKDEGLTRTFDPLLELLSTLG